MSDQSHDPYTSADWLQKWSGTKDDHIKATSWATTSGNANRQDNDQRGDRNPVWLKWSWRWKRVVLMKQKAWDIELSRAPPSGRCPLWCSLLVLRSWLMGCLLSFGPSCGGTACQGFSQGSCSDKTSWRTSWATQQSTVIKYFGH